MRSVWRVPTRTQFTACALFCGLAGGCTGLKLDEVRGKSATGPEYQDKGDHTDQVRYYGQAGLDFKWSNGWTSGVTYRYRAVDDGNGDQEQLVLFDVSFPLWKAKKPPDKNAERIQALEDQIKQMREQQSSAQEFNPTEGLAQKAEALPPSAVGHSGVGVDTNSND